MSSANDWHRVLWHEGMYLLPQQFQQWDRNQQRQLQAQGEALQPHPWGFTALELDADALSAGNLRLVRCAGILPDGFGFDLPAGGELPAGRALPAGGQRCRAFLALPERRGDGALWSEDGQHAGAATRFLRRDLALRDGSPEGLEDPVAIALPQLRLLLDEEAAAGHVAVPVGEFVRDAGGSWSAAPGSCPPVLHLAAAPALRAVVLRIREFLAVRAQELLGQRRERTAGAVEFSVSEIRQVLTAMAVNRCLPLIADALAHGRTHPQQIHLELARLAAEAATFASHDAATLPVYDHQAPIVGLETLLGVLREALGTSQPTRYVPLRLRAVNDRISSSDLPEGLAESATLYLDLYSPLPADQLMQQVPVKCKVSSAGRIGGLVAKALRGLELSYLSVPPSELPARPDHHYFELQPIGPEWDEIRKAGSIAIYTPPDLGELGLELLAVRS